MTSTEVAVAVANVAELDALEPAAREIAVTGMLSQCRIWLATAVEATEPKRVSEFKAFVATIAETTKQLNLSKEIQLDSSEMVRRAERGVGIAIRKAQASGEMTDRGRRNNYGGPGYRQSRDETLSSPVEILTTGSDRAATYGMTDGVSDEQFDEVITEAKEEGNLSRANVLRKIKAANAAESCSTSGDGCGPDDSINDVIAACKRWTAPVVDYGSAADRKKLIQFLNQTVQRLEGGLSNAS